MRWLFSGESWWHDLLRLTFNSIVGFVASAAALYLSFKVFGAKAKQWLSPFSAGGIGNIPDQNGIPLHKRLEQ